MENLGHQFNDYLREKARVSHDTAKSEILILIAEAYEDFQKQGFIASQTDVVNNEMEGN